MNSSEIKALLLSALAAEVDGRLADVAFTRSPRSAEFTRKLPDAIQVLNVDLAVNPPYSREAIAHVYPRVRLSIPSVCQKAAELVAGNPVLLANAPQIMVNRPLEHLVPKAERVQWYAFQKDDFTSIARGVADAFLKWGVPFFDHYRTAGEVVKGFDEGDDRPKLQENWAIFVAAALLVEGHDQRAVELIGSTFRSPGSRKKYALVFTNLERIAHRSASDSERPQTPRG
jgi:hypothetical protein